MNSKNALQFALVAAAAIASEIRHYDKSGFGINRREYRRRYGKRKGGGRGVGMISGLPKSGDCIAREGARKPCGRRNLKEWERRAWGLA